MEIKQYESIFTPNLREARALSKEEQELVWLLLEAYSFNPSLPVQAYKFYQDVTKAIGSGGKISMRNAARDLAEEGKILKFREWKTYFFNVLWFDILHAIPNKDSRVSEFKNMKPGSVDYEKFLGRVQDSLKTIKSIDDLLNLL
jgi:hypothetical protein